MKKLFFKLFPAITIVCTLFLALNSFAEEISSTDQSTSYLFGLHYLNTIESNSESSQKGEGFKMERNVNNYGVYFGFKLSTNDLILVTPKLSSTIDKNANQSGRIHNDNIEFRYKRKNLIDKEKIGLNFDGELRHELFTGDEKRSETKASGESHLRLTAEKDIADKISLFTQYRFYFNHRRSGDIGVSRLQHRAYVTPYYLFSDRNTF